MYSERSHYPSDFHGYYKNGNNTTIAADSREHAAQLCAENCGCDISREEASKSLTQIDDDDDYDWFDCISDEIGLFAYEDFAAYVESGEIKIFISPY